MLQSVCSPRHIISLTFGSYISIAKSEWHHWILVFNFLAGDLNASLISLAEHHIRNGDEKQILGRALDVLLSFSS